MSAPALEVVLPTGWYAVDVDDATNADAVERLLQHPAEHIDRVGDVDVLARTSARPGHRIISSHSRILLVRPPPTDGDATDAGGGTEGTAADDAFGVSGTILVRPAHSGTAEHVRAALDADGHSTALGCVDGQPVIAVVGREPLPDGTGQLLTVSYLVLTASATVVLVFAAVESAPARAIVAEIARVRAGVRIVRDCEASAASPTPPRDRGAADSPDSCRET